MIFLLSPLSAEQYKSNLICFKDTFDMQYDVIRTVHGHNITESKPVGVNS
jgi:hypothetical protein